MYALEKTAVLCLCLWMYDTGTDIHDQSPPMMT